MTTTSTYSVRRRLLLLFGGIFIFALGLIPLEPESAAEPPPPSPVTPEAEILARVDGRVVTAAQIEDLAAAELLELERRRHEIVGAHLEKEIRRLLLVAAAEGEGLSPESYLESRLSEISGQITSADVEAYHAERGIHQSLAQAGEQIRLRLARERLDAELEAAHTVRRSLEPFRAPVEARGPSQGPDAAPVTVVEFSDFLCPFCGRAVTALEEVRARYGDQVRLVVRQFPQEIHEISRKISEAALCADRQGLYWEFHDRAFGDQNLLEGDDAGLQILIDGLEGLDRNSYDDCLQSGATRAEVDADLAAGRLLGVDQTPTFFVNGRRLGGNADFKHLTALIDDELQRVAEN